MNPYVLPEGFVVINLSGGRTSAYMLFQILLANGGTLPERCVVVFTNTGREMPETLDFVRDIAFHWDVDVVWLEYRPEAPFFERVTYETASRNGEPFEMMVRKERYVPNPSARTCTKNLKILTAKRWLVAQGWREWISAVGIRFDELHRIKPQKRERWVKWHPLADAKVAKADIIGFWGLQNFDLKLATVNGSCPDGNCDGCFLKSEAYLASFYRRMPERAAWWPQVEAMATELVGKPEAARFRRDYSRAELHDFVDRQSDLLLKVDGILCQASGGECFG